VRFLISLFALTLSIHAEQAILQKSEIGKTLISPNGRYILYGLLQTDPYNKYEFAIKDLWTGTERNGQIDGAYLYGNSDSVAVTNDGSKVVFISWNGLLTPGEGGGLFVKDLNLNIIRRIDVQSDGSIIPNSGGWSFWGTDVAVSGDGASVVFAKRVYTDGTWAGGQSVNIYRKSLVDGILQMIDSSPSGSFIPGSSAAPSVSSDGDKILFSSNKNGIITDDNDGQEDIFLKNLSTGSVTRLNVTGGSRFGSGDYAWSAKITPNGHYAIFSSGQNLASNSVYGKNNLYKIDLSTSEITCISTSETYRGGAFYPATSNARIIFQSQEWTYEPSIGKSIAYAYSYDLSTHAIVRFPEIQPLELPSAFDVNILAGETALSENGKIASFWSWARWISSDNSNSGNYYAIQIESNNPPENFDQNGDGITDGVAISLGYSPTLNLAPFINFLKTNPTAGLYNQSQFDANWTNAQRDILNNPNSRGLYTTSQIQNMALGDLVLSKNPNGSFVLNYDIEQSTDLQNWTTYAPLSTPLTGLPADKAFVRIKAKH
jgi:hypothetical protein